MAKNAPLVIVGIDLTGSPQRPTGLCVLHDLRAETLVTFSDDEIIHFVKETRPTFVPSMLHLVCPKAGARFMIVRANICGSAIEPCSAAVSASSP